VHLVGARPTPAVRALAARPGVSLVANAPAMAPEIASGAVTVIPMRSGSGLQNKVLEAMAVGTPVVTTPQVAAALAARDGEHLRLGASTDELARAAVALLRDAPARRGRHGPRARSSPHLRMGGLRRGRRKRLGGCGACTIPAWRIALTPRGGLVSPGGVHRRDKGWRARWAMLVTGDLLVAPVAYLAAFAGARPDPVSSSRRTISRRSGSRRSRTTGRRCWPRSSSSSTCSASTTRARSSTRRTTWRRSARPPVLQALLMVSVYFFRRTSRSRAPSSSSTRR
jgi:hypothetical protein